MILGLTGGMGCGKTTAARIFEQHGFRRVDSDALVRDRVLTAPDIIAEARRRFGLQILAPAGGIDRPALARLLFADETGARLRAWEDLVLPRVLDHWRALLSAAHATHNTRWIIEAPLLHEKTLEKWFDFIVCVASSPATQYARLAERGVTHALAAQRISRQMPLADKINKADYVLTNDGSLEFLHDQIRHLIANLPTTHATHATTHATT